MRSVNRRDDIATVGPVSLRNSRTIRIAALIALAFAALLFTNTGAQVATAALGDSIAFTGIDTDGEGAAVWNTDPGAPEAEKTGHHLYWDPVGLDQAYYYLASRDYSNIDPTANGAFHGGEPVIGFPNFQAALVEGGFGPDDLTATFGPQSLGEDIEGEDWTYAEASTTETRYYQGGGFTLKLDGQDMVGGLMPQTTLIIEYGVLGDPFDDRIWGYTEAAEVEDRSGPSTPAVQAAAAGFIADVGENGLKYIFDSLQPAAQTDFGGNGRAGAFFDAQQGRLEVAALPVPPPAPLVEIGDIVLAPGGTGVVDITFRNIPADGLSGYYVVLDFDTTTVHVTGVLGGDHPFDTPPDPPGPLQNDRLNIDNQNGNLELQKDLGFDGPEQGDQLVVRLELLATGDPGDSMSFTDEWPLVDAVANEGGDWWEPEEVIGGNVAIEGAAATGEIHGVKWFDLDEDGILDMAEPYLPGWTIYLDLDDNSHLDAGEPSTTTAASGAFRFTDLPPATYVVREVQQPDWIQTFPTSTDAQIVVLNAGQVVTMIDFGNAEEEERGEIYGAKFLDANRNGEWDFEEPGLEGWTIYLDLDENGELDDGEPYTTTTANGDYWFGDLEPGRYVVREAPRAGWWQTAPAAFTARLEGGSVTPPVTTTATGKATFDLDLATLEMSFQSAWMDLTGDAIGLFIREGYEGETGPVLYDLAVEAGVPNPELFYPPVDGVITSTDPSLVGLLYGGGLYVELHSEGMAGPELRGQIWPSGGAHEVYVESGEMLHGIDFGNYRKDELSCMIGVCEDDNTHDWTLVWTGEELPEEAVRLTVAAVSVNPAETGSILVTIEDDIGTSTLEVIHPTHDRNVGELELHITPGQVYPFTVERTAEARHYRLGASHKKLAIAHTEVRYLESDLQAWAIRVAGDEAVELQVATDTDAEVGQASEVELVVVDPVASTTVYGPDVRTLTLDVPEVFTFTNDTSTPRTLVVLATTDGHFRMRKVGGDENLYVVPCPMKEKPDIGGISGLKYHDLNRNGMYDEGEPGLPGWTIYLDENDNGEFDVGEPNTTTVPSGHYWFEDLDPGDYAVREVLMPGWRQTQPSEFVAYLEGDKEAPPVTTTEAWGKGEFNFDPDSGQLTFYVDFGELAGAPTGLHIHAGPEGVNGPALYDLGDMAGLDSPVVGSVALDPAHVSLLESGGLYVNLQSEGFPDGEVRDQIWYGDGAHRVDLGPGDMVEFIDFANYLTECEGVCGDQDDDGEVTILDAIIDMQIVAGYVTATPTQSFLSDLDGDGEITVMDVIMTLQHLVGSFTITSCGPSAP